MAYTKGKVSTVTCMGIASKYQPVKCKGVKYENSTRWSAVLKKNKKKQYFLNMSPETGIRWTFTDFSLSLAGCRLARNLFWGENVTGPVGLWPFWFWSGDIPGVHSSGHRVLRRGGITSDRPSVENEIVYLAVMAEESNWFSSCDA